MKKTFKLSEKEVALYWSDEDKRRELRTEAASHHDKKTTVELVGPDGEPIDQLMGLG